MIRAVIFDMDGLLIDTEPHWQATEREVFSELGIQITPEMQKSTYGLRTDEQIGHWYDFKPWKGADFGEVANRYESTMLNYFNKEAALMNGAIEALDFFSDRGLPLALASSSNMTLINAFLDKFTLHHYFREVYSAEFEKFGKPHPAVYLETASRLNTSAAQCLALEDSFHGVIAAKAAKMKCIAVPDKGHADDPRFHAADMILTSLTELNENSFHQLNNL